MSDWRHGLTSQLPTAAEVAAARHGKMLVKPLPAAVVEREADRKAERALRSVYRQVEERDGRRCRRCRCALTPQRWEHHHIVFRSAGGKDTTANLALLCRACHGLIHTHRVAIVGRNAWKTLKFIAGPLGERIKTILSPPPFPKHNA